MLCLALPLCNVVLPLMLYMYDIVVLLSLPTCIMYRCLSGSFSGLLHCGSCYVLHVCYTSTFAIPIMINMHVRLGLLQMHILSERMLHLYIKLSL